MAEIQVTDKSKLEKLKNARQGYITAKVNFNNQYAELSQYYYQIKQSYQPYTPQVIQGQFENDGNINDNVGSKSARLMASALMGMVWKDEKGTFRLIRSQHIPESEETKAYFNRISGDTATYMERPKSRLTTSLFKTILESVIYGTSGMVTQKGDYDSPVKYFNKSILSFYIGYNKEGEIKEIFIDYSLSADELYDRYGALAGAAVAQAIQNNDHIQRFVMCEAIRPRSAAMTKDKAGKLGMPFSAERFMPDQNIYLEDGGYESLPLKVLFQEKLEYESYGRGAGMAALPTVVQANIATEILAVGGELIAQPALGMHDNGSLAGLAVDLSAGALNVFNVAGTVPKDNPIFPLFTVGDLNVIFEWYKILKEEVAGYFLLDKLYDLQTKQRMTLGEAVMREQIRSDALSPIFTQIMAFLTEVLTRSVDILYGMGLMGVPDPTNLQDPKVAALLANGLEPFKIPDAVLKAQLNGIDWYDIQFISPAARIMNSEELASTLKFIAVMGEAGAISPEFIDVIDPDGTAEKLKMLTATDSIVTRTPQARKAIRENRAKMQIQIAKVEMEAKLAAADQARGQGAAARSGAFKNIQETGGES
ncbi:MAG: hypothetical protein KAU50_04420 [Candidatus Marinimicrobia bacterium]|nr:hypothetical protein [Candidatus Neomarinimicrobiota bacterium]